MPLLDGRWDGGKRRPAKADTISAVGQGGYGNAPQQAAPHKGGYGQAPALHHSKAPARL